MLTDTTETSAVPGVAVVAIHQLQHHLETVSPGLPYRISEAAVPGDGVWQGDLGVEIVESLPEDYVRVENPTSADHLLVLANTPGVPHCLDSLDGVSLYRPPEWGDIESLRGPGFVLSKERTITHPTHGDVTIPAGFTVCTRYQREYDAEQRRVRRVRD